MRYNYIICNGRIVDGKGNPWHKGSIAIKSGRIDRIGKISEQVRLKV